MMTTEATEALKFLEQFTHASRTNLAKKKLTNHDALAVFLFYAGTMKHREIQDALMTWRFGAPEWTTRAGTYRRFDEKTRKYSKDLPCIIKIPKMCFTYLMNGTDATGYNFVAKTIAGARVEMSGWKAGKKPLKSGEPWPSGRDYEWVRRQYWYRSHPGHYAITVEGVARCLELGLSAK